MNKIQRWLRCLNEAELAFPLPFESETASASVQRDDGQIGIWVDDHGVTASDALALAEWILNTCGEEFVVEGEFHD